MQVKHEVVSKMVVSPHFTLLLKHFWAFSNKVLQLEQGVFLTRPFIAAKTKTDLPL